MKQVEIMAPAGSFESLQAALKGGANSIYFGVEQLNMRAKAANNFKLTDLEEVVAICSAKDVKTYLTVNTILYNHDLKMMRKLLDEVKRTGVTAIIASDLAAIMYANEIGVEVHISTQLNVSNIDEVTFFSKYADVIVLARELTLKQVKFIVEEIERKQITGPGGELVRVELFAHGALCVAISGKCYMSLATYNSSANRGACLQNCRRSYKVIDEETGDELVIDNKYIMSPKDLSTISIVDQMVDAGVTVLKLEGRGRASDYVYTVTKVYRDAVDAYQAGTYTEEKIAAWKESLLSVFNRGLWEGGYYLGKKLGEWSASYGSQAKKEKVIIGKATHYYAKAKRAVFRLESGGLKKGDNVIITGKTTGIITMTINGMFVNDAAGTEAKKGDEVVFDVPERVRTNDKLFLIINRKPHA